MSQIGNWIVENCNTVGNGDLVLTGSKSGFASFFDAIPAGLVWYSIEDGSNREAGIGTFDGVNTIARTTVHSTLVGGVYNDSSPSPIALSGLSTVSCTFNASAFRDFITSSFIESGTTDGDRLSWSNISQSWEATSNILNSGSSDNDLLSWNNSSQEWDVASSARVVDPTLGGLEANNTLTGVGFERVVTSSDLASFTPVDAGTANDQTLVWNDTLSKWEVSVTFEGIISGIRALETIEFGNGSLGVTQGLLGFNNGAFRLRATQNDISTIISGTNTGGSERNYLTGNPNLNTILYHPLSNTQSLRTIESFNGAVEVNNTLTGGGWERILTVGDLGGLTEVDPGTAAEQSLVWDVGNNKWEVSTRYREDGLGIRVITGIEFGDGNLSGASRGFIGHASNIFEVRSESLGEPILLIADNSTSAPRNLILANPDDDVKIYHPNDNLEAARTIDVTSGALEVNNQLTGGGFERVLTTSDGIAAVPPTTQVFTSNGTWNKPAGLKWAKITVTGGGGSGGGKHSTLAYQGSAGGAGGSAISTIAAASLGATESVTVGAGGALTSVGNDGNDGASSSFGTHVVATGGFGGKSGNNVNNSGGAGGNGTAGQIQLYGGTGGYNPTATSEETCCPGGVSMWGGSGGLLSASNIVPPGCGGFTQNGLNVGSVGGDGIVIIEEFY